MSQILIVEDEEMIGIALRQALTVAGFRVEWARTAAEAIAAHTPAPDLVLLDLGLPDADGLDVCRALRLQYPTSAIAILTARRDSLDVVAGLESGADDYLLKPFSIIELLARVRAHLRRSSISDPTTIEVGSLVIDRGPRTAALGARELVLSPREFDLLARLGADAGSAVARETLMADVWDENWFGSTKTLDVHIAAIRRKLDEAASKAELAVADAAPVIRTLRGFGYQLRPATARLAIAEHLDGRSV